ncbi:phage tail assembly protein [Asaia astilbis]|uniref:phage tail assembly protein n=1 Tax=Asaia astilbis TaxID=610244 RepID=UPI0004707A10|nr:phage tail assembly protein [Asaia astilbis]
MNTPTDAEVMAALADAAQENETSDEGRLVLTFEPAISVKGNEYSRLELSEPCVFHVLEASKKIGNRPTQETVYDSQIDLVARVSGWPLTALHALPSRKLDEAIIFVTDFEEKARRQPDEAPSYDDERVLFAKREIEAVNSLWRDMTLREPSVAERRVFKVAQGKGNVTAYMRGEMQLVSSISKWPDAAILKMPISLFARAADYCTGFFIPGPQTGSSSAQT